MSVYKNIKYDKNLYGYLKLIFDSFIYIIFSSNDFDFILNYVS